MFGVLIIGMLSESLFKWIILMLIMVNDMGVMVVDNVLWEIDKIYRI